VRELVFTVRMSRELRLVVGIVPKKTKNIRTE